jgi:hypothetical protein
MTFKFSLFLNKINQIYPISLMCYMISSPFKKPSYGRYGLGGYSPFCRYNSPICLFKHLKNFMCLLLFIK